MKAMKPQTSHFTSLDPFSHLEYEALVFLLTWRFEFVFHKPLVVE